MGLDTVELIMAFEKYFAIEIPDREAEKLDTLGAVTDYMCQRFSITSDSTELRDRIFNKLKAALNNPGIESTHLVSLHIREGQWTRLKNELQLEVPDPVFKEAITMEDLVTAICIENYLSLIDRKNIKSRYEVYVAVGGITLNQAGVSPFELAPDKSFTNDLGLD